MPKKKIYALEEVKKNYVRLALESGNYSSIARHAGISRATLTKWIKEYEDEVRDQMEDPTSAILSTEPTKEELKAKCEHAMRLLGVKELEVAMLRSLLKKPIPALTVLEEVRLWAEEGFPITKLSEVAGINRSLYYYHSGTEEVGETKEKRGRPIPGYSMTNTGLIIPDEQIEEFLMEAVEGDGATYGVKNLTQYLRDVHDLLINHKEVARLCKGLGILLPQRTGNPKYPKRLVRNRLITAPNQLWQLDIKYGSIAGSGRFFFVASVIDVFDRAIVGYYRGPRCKAKDITGMLKEAIIRRGLEVKEEDNYCIVIRTDNGPQFVSNLFGEFCEQNKIFHERIPPRSPNYNAYIESFFSILERNLFQRYDFEYFEEAYYRVDEFMEFYNNRRYHGSLGRMSPQKYHEKYKDIGFPKEMAISI